jgi:hypothetical protein
LFGITYKGSEERAMAVGTVTNAKLLPKLSIINQNATFAATGTDVGRIAP